MKHIIKHKVTYIGIVTGAVAGFFYNRFIGCSNGTCMILSNPLNTSLYGALTGGLLFSLFTKKI